jgi:hypothetical protein
MSNTRNVEFEMYFGGLNYPFARRNESSIKALVTDSLGLKRFIFFMDAKALHGRAKYEIPTNST